MKSLPQIAFAVVVLFALVAIAMAMFKKNGPRYVATRVMTPNEIEFFHRLCKAFPDHHVFPQVSMAALIKPVQNGDKGNTAFWKISQKRVDYAICTKSMHTAAIVELDDRTHNASKDALRDAMPSSAGIVTFRFESRDKPSVGQLREAMLPTLSRAA